MNSESQASYTAFEGYRRIARGALASVALAIKRAMARDPAHAVLIFDDTAGRPIDIDVRGSEEEVLARFGTEKPGLIRELLEVLVREGMLVKINEDLYFHSAALDDLRGKIVDHIRETGGLDAQGFKNLTGLSRKFSIPLLEYFDKIKVTLRIGDKRILRGQG